MEWSRHCLEFAFHATWTVSSLIEMIRQHANAASDPANSYKIIDMALIRETRCPVFREELTRWTENIGGWHYQVNGAQSMTIELSIQIQGAGVQMSVGPALQTNCPFCLKEILTRLAKKQPDLTLFGDLAVAAMAAVSLNRHKDPKPPRSP